MTAFLKGRCRCGGRGGEDTPSDPADWWKGGSVAASLLALVPEANRPQAAEMIARLVNLGVRCSPRGVQHTVRFNAVHRAVRGLPVKVSMKEVRDEKTGRSFNALVTEPVGGKPTVEGPSEE